MLINILILFLSAFCIENWTKKKHTWIFITGHRKHLCENVVRAIFGVRLLRSTCWWSRWTWCWVRSQSVDKMNALTLVTREHILECHDWWFLLFVNDILESHGYDTCRYGSTASITFQSIWWRRLIWHRIETIWFVAFHMEFWGDFFCDFLWNEWKWTEICVRSTCISFHTFNFQWKIKFIPLSFKFHFSPSFGSAVTFMTSHSKWSELFPKIRSKQSTFNINLTAPVSREINLSLGFCSASANSLTTLMKQSNDPNDKANRDGYTSTAVALIVGQFQIHETIKFFSINCH